MTHPSKSKTRSVAAIGYGCVIPAKAGIHFAAVKSQWMPVFAGMTEKGSAVVAPSKSKTQSVAAIGNGCVIPAKSLPSNALIGGGDPASLETFQ